MENKNFIFRLRIKELEQQIKELKEENKNLNFMLEKQLDWHFYRKRKENKTK